MAFPSLESFLYSLYLSAALGGSDEPMFCFGVDIIQVAPKPAFLISSTEGV